MTTSLKQVHIVIGQYESHGTTDQKPTIYTHKLEHKYITNENCKL